MRHCLSFLLLLAGVFSAGAQDTVSRAQVQADLEFMTRTIESIHPNPWHQITRREFDRVRDSIARTLPARMAAWDAWMPVARLCATLDEGHTNAEFPQELVKEIVANKVPLFPLNLAKVKADGFIVAADYSATPQLQDGDRILSINNKTTKAIYQQLASLYGGLPAWRGVRVKEQPALLFYLAGLRSPYRIVYLRNGKTQECTLEALPYKEFRPRRDAYRAQHPAPAVVNSFERLPGNVGLIRFNDMSGDPRAFDSFLTRTFEEIRVKPVSGLLVDLRENGGGNSVHGWYLLQYITAKPFRMSGGVRWKVSPEMRNRLLQLDSARRAGYASYISQPDGYMFEGGGDDVKAPDTNYLRYKGPVGVLIGPNTFSSANMTANTIGDYKLATLIGEPSGEPANDYGELVGAVTPNSKIPFTTCAKYFIRANGNGKDTNPVLPDITVKQDPKSKDDTVLEFARQWALRQNK